MLHRNIKLFFICAVFLCALAPVRPASALQISGEEFTDTFKDEGLDLVLMGVALKRFQILKAVAVGLYLEKDVEEEEILTSVPKRVEIVLIQRISRDEFIEEAVEGIRANLSPEAFANIGPDIERFSSWIRVGDPGDRYAFTYRPGEGTRIDLNGVNQGIIEAEDFAKGYFSSYVGAKPTDPRARGKLLGGLEYFK